MDDTSTGELTPRQHALLMMIVRDYIASAVPIGSEAIARRYNLSLSSATIRNEMAELERGGYIAHPHTSAGRIPTDKGYRYFVTRQMDEYELSTEEQRLIRHQFHQVEMELDHWAQLAASVLARAANNVALVTLPATRHSRLRHLELLPLQDRVVLLVVVLQEGRVRQQLVTLPSAVDDDALRELARRLSAALDGLSAIPIEAAIDQRKLDLSLAERAIVEQVVKVLRQVDLGHAHSAHYEGLLEALRQPEFSRSENVRLLVEALEQREVWSSILPSGLAAGEIWLAIGNENPLTMLRDCSLVLTRYGRDDCPNGVLGVIGPTRMPYSRTIATVRCLSTVMGDLMTALVPGDPRSTYRSLS